MVAVPPADWMRDAPPANCMRGACTPDIVAVPPADALPFEAGASSSPGLPTEYSWPPSTAATQPQSALAMGAIASHRLDTKSYR